MNQILIHIKVFTMKEEQDIWVSPCFVVEELMQRLKALWLHGRYRYENGLYLMEEKRFLDLKKTLEENQVIQGDHLILY